MSLGDLGARNYLPARAAADMSVVEKFRSNKVGIVKHDLSTRSRARPAVLPDAPADGSEPPTRGNEDQPRPLHRGGCILKIKNRSGGGHERRFVGDDEGRTASSRSLNY